MEKIEVIYEDSEVLVLNKPAGITVTSEGVKKGETVEDWIGAYLSVALLPKRNGIVHRLDKGTSGLLVVAKNQASLENLQAQFKKRSVKKRYWALAGGNLAGSGEINAPIGRNRYIFSRWRVSPEGKSAQTSFKMIKKFQFSGKWYSLIEVNLKSGRTHQIRVHFSYLGWPLVGDKTYGGEKIGEIDRPFLQAKVLEFDHPTTQKRMIFETELAPDLIKLMGVLSNE